MASPPAAKNLTETQLDDLPWGEEDLSSSLHQVYDHVRVKTVETIDWYMSRKRVRAVLSQGLRFGAIFFATVGSLVPLLRAAELWPKNIPGEMGQVGYVGFAMAAGCVALDRFFGLSTSWMRYITSAFALQRALAEFQLEWAVVQVKLGGRQPTREQAEQMLLRLKEFRSAVLEVVERETQSWVSEFQTNLAELYRVSRSRADALEPGMLDVAIANGMEVEGEITVSVDGAVRERFRGTRTQITGVFAGHHVVQVQGVIRGVAVEISG
ncbi:MAG TPA: SLATT domain-containing protein, partial [Candidatus Nanopelagicales bacterium]|nr:SLATT domain-containing protein [Candidatus Nanopelagicales bacterium]